MSDLAHFGTVLVIAPHPDDEILGCGGTMARLTDAGNRVVVAVVTKGQAPAFDPAFVAQVRDELAAAHNVIGVNEVRFLDLPAAAMDTLAGATINSAFDTLVRDIQPDTMFVPFIGDIHTDHQLAFTGAMVAARPRNATIPLRIFAYETLSETNWYAPGITPAFLPNLYIEISATIDRKLAAFRCFSSQVRDFPDERSIRAIEALATLRGAAVYRDSAEAFMVIRQIE
nr:PIG-L deacetylase family protein [Novosphingobium lentum]